MNELWNAHTINFTYCDFICPIQGSPFPKHFECLVDKVQLLECVWKYAWWYVVYPVDDASCSYSLFPTSIYLHKHWVSKTKASLWNAL